MAHKFALFTKGSKLPLNKDFINMFELLQSCAQPSICILTLVFDIFVYRFMHHSSFIAQIVTKRILKEHISMDIIPTCLASVIVLLTVLSCSGKIYVHK